MILRTLRDIVIPTSSKHINTVRKKGGSKFGHSTVAYPCPRKDDNQDDHKKNPFNGLVYKRAVGSFLINNVICLQLFPFMVSGSGWYQILFPFQFDTLHIRAYISQKSRRTATRRRSIDSLYTVSSVSFTSAII